jgi:hypothetical protein
MERLSALNVVGVAAIGLLAAVSAGLAIHGLATGSAHSIHAAVFNHSSSWPAVVADAATVCVVASGLWSACQF